MRPCAIQFDAQAAASLSWPEVRDSEFIWDFDDGGSRTDAEGFMAAVVYQNAGTYHATVTVDGETWNSQTITVTEPSEVACVSPSSDWTNCPAGAEHYTSLSSALSGTGSNAHILLEGGASHGALPDGGSDVNVLIGAYDNAASNPTVSAGDTTPADGWVYQDLNITGGSRLFEGAGLGKDVLWHRVTAPGGPQFISFVFDVTGAFIIDSNITGGDYAIYIGSADCDRFVLKGTRLHAPQSGQHTFRVQGCDRLLIQDSTITHVGDHDSLTLRGDDEWLLVQNNYFDDYVAIKPENSGETARRRYLIFERSVVEVEEPEGIEVRSTQSAVFRNNIILGAWQSGINAAGGDNLPNSDLQFFNNTFYNADVNTNARVVGCNGDNCVARNNLAVAKPTSTGIACVTGATAESNNWCFTTQANSWCRDPQTGSSTCYDPSFMSTTYGNADFMRPGAGTRGIDAAYQTVPVWSDSYNVLRAIVDVGAVER
jgi:hypothetical protein